MRAMLLGAEPTASWRSGRPGCLSAAERTAILILLNLTLTSRWRLCRLLLLTTVQRRLLCRKTCNDASAMHAFTTPQMRALKQVAVRDKQAVR